MGSLGQASKLPPLPVNQATAVNDLDKLLRPHLGALECYPMSMSLFNLLTFFAGPPPPQSLRASTLAMIAGFLVRAIQDGIDCDGCLLKLRAPTSHSTTTALIAGIDRGGLSYPTLAFVGFVSHLENAASSVAPALVRGPQPLKRFSSRVLPSVLKNPLFECRTDKTVSHRTNLVNLLRKFMRPFLANFANGSLTPRGSC
ncbi:unnamed protein product [Ixodes hexagonus]